MPGITGIIGLGPPAQRREEIERMVQTMKHEPFYSSGVMVQEELGCWLGWTCRQGSYGDCLPVWNETRDVCLLFAGENFMDRSVMDQLKGGGHQFDPETASALVHLYEEAGPKFVEQLNGWFSGVIVDLRSKQVLLFNDRYGLGRVYLHESDGALYFSSEAKSLLKILPALRKFDPRGLGEYFSCGCALQDRTLFEGIKLMPGGSLWTFTGGGRPRKDSYFRREMWEQQERLSVGDYYEQLRETFARVLPRYFGGREKVAVSLTGGVDSRLVMAWAKRPPGSLPCYTFGGSYRECGDVTLARQVAGICGQPHEVIPVGEKFLSEFPSLAARTVYLSDGAMDVSGSPDLFVNRRAREIAPVRLTGNYGGEILRSLVAVKPMPIDGRLLEPEFARLRMVAAQTYASEMEERKLSFVAFKQVPWHHHSRLSVELSQLNLRSPYLDNELVGLVFRAPPEAATSNELSLRLIADGNAELARMGTDRGVLHRSIPVVTPLRHFYQEFTFKAEYAYDYGMPNWLTKVDNCFSVLHFEKLFLGRHKFYHFRIWYRRQLAEFLRDTLLGGGLRDRAHFNRRRVEEIVLSHVEGRENHTLAIHRILSTELIQRQLLESQ